MDSLINPANIINVLQKHFNKYEISPNLNETENMLARDFIHTLEAAMNPGAELEITEELDFDYFGANGAKEGQDDDDDDIEIDVEEEAESGSDEEDTSPTSINYFCNVRYLICRNFLVLFLRSIAKKGSTIYNIRSKEDSATLLS